MKKEKEVSTSGNVFANLGFAPEEAANLKLRSQLMMTLEDEIKKRKLKQVDAAGVLGVSQSRVSDLERGAIDKFTIDALVKMLAKLNVDVKITTKQRRAA